MPEPTFPPRSAADMNRPPSAPTNEGREKEEPTVIVAPISSPVTPRRPLPRTRLEARAAKPWYEAREREAYATYRAARKAWESANADLSIVQATIHGDFDDAYSIRAEVA